MKEKKSLQDRLKALDKLAENINKANDYPIVGRLSTTPELKENLKVEYVPTQSFNLNEIMGGGIPKAKITIVCGKEDSGKTYLLLETIAKAQKEDPNFIAAWLEAEGSISIDDIRMLGIDESRFFYQPFDSKNGGEAAIDIIEATLKAGVDFYAVNSLKCLVPSEELNSSMTKQSIGLQARMNAKMMRKLKPLIVENRTAFAIVQHLSTAIGMRIA